MNLENNWGKSFQSKERIYAKALGQKHGMFKKQQESRWAGADMRMKK